MGRTLRVAALAAFVGIALAMIGCTTKPEAPALQPKVAPPAIAKEGTLTVGVDLKTPPFAGTDSGRKAGIDVDVATALAEKLGLHVAFVDVAPSEAATALADGTADAVMSVPFDSGALSRMSLAGSYLADAPAFFISTGATASVEPSLTLDTLTAPKVAVQTGSLAYWLLADELGESGLSQYGTLREALEALDSGKADVVAGDAIVGAYIIRDIPALHFAGQLAPASALSVAVGPDNTKLADAIRDALDELAADGVLAQARRTWVGSLPELAVPDASETSATP